MIGVVALVWTVHSMGLRTLGIYLEQIGWWWFAVVALEVVITSLDAVAIRAFMSPEQGSVRFRSALLSQLAGRAVNAVTPSGNVGEAVKISVLAEHVSDSRAVATILLYNIVSFTVELGMVAVAAPVMVLLVPMPTALKWMFLVACLICTLISVGLYFLVRAGTLASIARLAVRLRILSKTRYARWEAKLSAVDDKLGLVAGARKRDRWLGIAMVVLSRLTSMTLSLMILHAIGGPITIGFVAGYTVGGFVVYMAATLVPMGIGVSELGFYKLFRLLGEKPGYGSALTIARRTTLVIYAAIGLILVTASETVKRARDRGRGGDVTGPPQPPRPIPVAVAIAVTPQHVTPTPATDAAD